MAFADKVIHVTMSGAMLGGAEEWQTGFYVGLAQGTVDAPSQEFVDGIRDLWETWFETAGHVHQSYTFTQVKAARLNIGGLYDGSGVVTSNPAAAVIGNYQGQVMPPQIALVATLIAGSGKGLAGKGRMYLPGVSGGIDSTGHLTGTYTQQIATNLATFFNGVNALASNPGVVINASRGQKNFAGLGARNVPINGIRVGNVYDTQRRRRNALAETYSTAVVTDTF